MWRLVEQYTGRVGYYRGTKAAGLDASPPVIDCSGWVGLLLTSAMNAQNADAGKEMFDAADIAACIAWSDRIILEVEARHHRRDVTSECNHRPQYWELRLGDKLPPRARYQSYRSSRAPPRRPNVVRQRVAWSRGQRWGALNATRRLAPRLRPLYRSWQSMGGRPVRDGQPPRSLGL